VSRANASPKTRKTRLNERKLSELIRKVRNPAAIAKAMKTGAMRPRRDNRFIGCFPIPSRQRTTVHDGFNVSLQIRVDEVGEPHACQGDALPGFCKCGLFVVFIQGIGACTGTDWRRIGIIPRGL
jgi:hypothetical protein